MTRPRKALLNLLPLALALSSAAALADPGCARPSESSGCFAWFSTVTAMVSVPLGAAALALACVVVVRRRTSEPGVRISLPRFLGATLACFAAPFAVGLLGWEVMSHAQFLSDGASLLALAAIGLSALLTAGFVGALGGRSSCTQEEVEDGPRGLAPRG